jgi:hypothetical protein
MRARRNLQLCPELIAFPESSGRWTSGVLKALSPKEAFVSRTMDPGRGKRRKLRVVRWSRAETVSVVLLLFVLIGEIICIALWLTRHPPD